MLREMMASQSLFSLTWFEILGHKTTQLAEERFSGSFLLLLLSQVGGYDGDRLHLMPHLVHGSLLVPSLVARGSVGAGGSMWGLTRQCPQQLLQHEEGQELRVVLCVGMTHVELQQLDSNVWLRPHRLPVLHAHTLRHKVTC